MTSNLIKFAVVNFGIYAIEKSLPYAFKWWNGNKTIDKSNPKNKLDVELCPVCNENLDFQSDEDTQDIEDGVFIFPRCKHKYHLKCVLVLLFNCFINF